MGEGGVGFMMNNAIIIELNSTSTIPIIFKQFIFPWNHLLSILIEKALKDFLKTFSFLT